MLQLGGMMCIMAFGLVILVVLRAGFPVNVVIDFNRGRADVHFGQHGN